MAKPKRRMLLIWLGGMCCIAIFLVTAAMVIPSVQGSPFEMVLEPSGSGGTVQFVQHERGLVSARFPINVPVARSETIVLDSDRAPIPQGTIGFSDTTVLPGRFKISFGGSEFDVMQRAIVVNGKEYAWQAE
jgi:hypothetical protein